MNKLDFTTKEKMTKEFFDFVEQNPELDTYTLEMKQADIYEKYGFYTAEEAQAHREQVKKNKKEN